MKKYLLPSLLILFAWQIASAQVPNKISYQGVVRNTNGTVVSNTGVGIRISVLQNSQTGNIVYAETQVRQTNLYGLFNLIIGDGNIVSGNINSIDWSTGVYFLKSEIDPAGGSNYVFISTTQLLSVPYALYAKTAGNAGSNYTAGSGISISGTNQIVNTSTNIPITLKDGGIVTVSGAYPNFTISGAATSGVNYTAGTGIVISGANVVVNSAPNIPVSLTGIGNVAITGTNNNFTINGQNLVAGSNITISGNAISAATPTSTPFTSIVGINGSTVTGTNNNFTINSQNLVAGSNITISGNAISAATPTSTPFTSIVGINGSTVTGTNNNFTINSQNLVAGSNITISGNAINAPSQNPLTSISGNNGLIVIPNGQAFTLDGANFIRTIVGLSGITINKSGSNYSISGSNTSQWLSPSANQIYTNSFVGIGVSAPLYSLDVNGDIDIATATAVYRIAGNVVLQTKGGNMMLGGAGNNIMTGDNNILNGAGAGINISSGFNNVINGYTAGQSNTTGYQNVFNGVGAGYGNTIGLGNVFEGNYAGSTNTTGNNNVAIGKLADLASNNLSNAIAIGANATVGGDNMMALGGTGLNAVKVGIGTGLPTATLDVIGNGRFTGSVTLAGLAGNVANLGVNANGQVITVAGNTGITSILGTNGISVTQNGSLFTISGTNSTLSGGITRIIEANMSSSANPSLSSPYKMVYDNIVSDIFNEFSSSTFTPKQPGYYLLECYARILFNDGDRLVLYKNGSYLSRGNGMFNSAGGDQSHVFSHNTFIVQANGTTDYFEVFAENQDNTAGTVVAIDQGYFKAFQLNAQSGTLTVTSVNSGSNSTITGNNGLIVIPNGNAFTLDGANFIRTIVGLSGITVNQSGSNYSISGSGGLTGAGQTNGLAYYTSANTLTSNGSNLSWNGSVMSINGIRFYTTSTGGNSSLSLGKDAGNTASTGNDNNFIGYSVGKSNTTGSNNNFLGNSAGFSNTDGNFNIAVGSQAGFSNSSGSYNNFIGVEAGSSNTFGESNNFIGYRAGSVNLFGNSNIAIGFQADFSGNGFNNAVAIGARATVGGSNMMALGGTGVNAVSVGIGTGTPVATLDVIGNGRFTGPVTLAGLAGSAANLGVNANGQIITVAGGAGIPTSILGNNLGVNQNGAAFTLSGVNTSISGNNGLIVIPNGNAFTLDGANFIRTIVGLTGITINQSGSNYSISGSNSNIFTVNGSNVQPIGYYAFNLASTTGVYRINGANALRADNKANILVGDAGNGAISGVGNIYIGSLAGTNSTSGSDNVAIGYVAGQQGVLGNRNVMLGAWAGQKNLSDNNIFVGFESGLNNTNGYNNAFVGFQAGKANVAGLNNVFVGVNAGLANTNGTSNVYIGAYVGDQNTGGAGNVSIGAATGRTNNGVDNVMIGANAGESSQGSNNIFFGKEAGKISTGQGNIIQGFRAGQSNITGSDNILIGTLANVGSSGLSNAVAIGTNATVGGSNMMALGGTGSNAVRVGIGTGSPSVRVHIVGDALGNDDLTIESYAPSANSASLSLSKARGTDASKLPITAGDRIGVVFFDGYNGTVFSRSSYIAAFAETDYGTSVNSNLVFYTASNGIPTEKIRITADGNVGIGTGTPNQRLAIVGNSSVTGVGYFSSIAGLALNGATAGSVVTVDGTGKLGFGTLASGGGSLSGAGQTNGLAYYTSANTLTSNGSNLSWNGREMNMNGIRFYTTSTGPNSSLVIGKDAGNTTFIGVNNNFIGYNAGYKNTTGDDNNFLGFWAGLNNATGSANNFLGSGAGYSNTTGSDNNFLGNQAGTSNTTGGGNNFIGANAGLTNTVGNNNIAIGREADMASNNLTNAIAIGFQAKVGGSNMMVLGGTGVYAVNVGIGTSTPGAPLDVRASGFAGNGELIAQFGTGASPRVRIYDEFSGPNLGPRIYFNAGAIGIIEGGGNIAIMPATGNVGIGTTAPGAALDVINAANGIRINQWLSTGASVGGGAYVGTNIYRNLSDNVWKYTNTHLNIGGAAIQFNGNDGAATENDILFVRTNTPGTVNADATVLESMRIKGGTGFVGIGTSTPEFPLDINRSATGTFTAANFFQNSGALANGAGTIGVSVRATGAFWSTGSSNSGGFYVSSDQRIKRKVGLSDSRNDLSTLMKLKITDYKYTDSLNTGNVQVKGVFAQEVEKVYPQAISKQTNWIPNIYAVAEQVAFDEANQTLKVTINKTHGLTIGDKVKLISNASGEKPAMVVSVNGNSFTVNKWTEKSEKIFVYGKEVNDFRIVDYDRIFILGISAIQELNKNLEAEKAKNMQLELQIQKMEAESKGIKAEIEMIKTHLGLEVKGQK